MINPADISAMFAAKFAEKSDYFNNYKDHFWDTREEWIEDCSSILLAEYIAASKYSDLVQKGIRSLLYRLTPFDWEIVLKSKPEYVYLLDKELADKTWWNLIVGNPLLIPFAPTRLVDARLLHDSLCWGDPKELNTEAEALRKKLHSRKGYIKATVEKNKK